MPDKPRRIRSIVIVLLAVIAIGSLTLNYWDSWCDCSVVNGLRLAWDINHGMGSFW